MKGIAIQVKRLQKPYKKLHGVKDRFAEGTQNASPHLHSKGRDIATGTFKQYVKDLGFKSESEFKDFLNSI